MPLTRRGFLTNTTIGVAALTIAGQSGAFARQTPSPTNATPVAENPDLKAILLAAMDEHGIPGAIVLVDSPGTGTWSTAAGVANLETREPMTTDMHMRIGSITKTFTATMILQLIDQGALKMDDTLASILPDQADLPNADTITIYDLLTMQSGLPDYVNADGILAASMDPTQVDKAFTPDELLDSIRDEPALFALGEKGVYSNTNYLLLGAIATEVTGTPWPELIQTGIIAELGLAQTIVPDGPDMPSPSPRGYAYAQEALPPPTSPEATATSATPVSLTASPPADMGPADVTQINTSIPASAGSMISTAEDLMTWMTAIRNGTLLSPELHESRMDFSNAVDVSGVVSDMKYSFGLVKANGMIGHDGGIEGFRSSMFYVPESETTIITLANVLPTRDASDPAGVLMDVIVNT